MQQNESLYHQECRKNPHTKSKLLVELSKSTSFSIRRFSKKLDTIGAHACVEHAGRRRTNSLDSFCSKLLSHGDGKAMSRLYNSRTQSYLTPYAQTRSELPSSLNKRTPTQTQQHRLPLVRETPEREANINNPSAEASGKESHTATDVYHFTQVSIENVGVYE